MPTLDCIRGRMIDIHTAHPGMCMKDVYTQMKKELGYSFPLKYIEDRIQVSYNSSGFIQWKERGKA